jgi:hypothetical protein
MSEMEMKNARVVHDVGGLVFCHVQKTHPLSARSFTKR